MAKRKIALDDFKTRNREASKELKARKKAANAEWRALKPRGKGLT